MKYHNVMTNRIPCFCVLLSLLTTPVAFAENNAVVSPNWTEADALAAISSVDTTAESEALQRLALGGDSTRLLQQAIAVRENDDWPVPAREYVLFSLARSFGDLPPGLIDEKLIRYLSSLEATVRVPHPDHPGASVPLFNTAAVMAGATTDWKRQEASVRAEELIAVGGQGWVEAYLDATPTERSGFRHSATAYPDSQLAGLANLAIDESEIHPELSVIGTMAGLRLGDADLFSRSLAHNTHPRLPEMARLSREVFQRKDLQNILLNAVRQAPASTASIVIAELAPALLAQPDVEDLMFELLGDRELGASAALVLSKHRSSRIRARLTSVAEDDSGLSARRAELALGASGGGQ